MEQRTRIADDFSEIRQGMEKLRQSGIPNSAEETTYVVGGGVSDAPRSTSAGATSAGITLVGGVITGVSITNPGDGYASGDVVTTSDDPSSD